MPKFSIRLRKQAGETKTAQIVNQIAGAVQSGKLGPGDLIPSERALAEQLGASRNIVRNAYQRLEDEGLIETSSTSARRVRAPGKKKGTARAARAGK